MTTAEIDHPYTSTFEHASPKEIAIKWAGLCFAGVPYLRPRTWEDATVTGDVDRDGFATPTDEFAAHVAALYPAGTSLAGAVATSGNGDAALVLLGHSRHADVKIARAIVWRSTGEDNATQYDWINASIRTVHHMYDLRAMGHDSLHFDQAAVDALRRAGVVVVSFSSSTESLAAVDTKLYEEIQRGEFAHDGDPILTSHIAAGSVVRVGPALFKVTRGIGSYPIDAFRALSTANAVFTRKG
jgi:hypothetical protein